MVFEPGEGLVEELTVVEGLSMEPTAAASLARKFFEDGKTAGSMLTATGEVVNPDTCGLPGWVLRYNGGVTTFSDATVSRFQVNGLDVVEVDVDLRRWPLLARQCANAALPLVNKLEFRLALWLRGKTEKEFPERILCGGMFSWLDPSRVPGW